MKKLILLAGILTVGFVSAKDRLPNNEKEVTENQEARVDTKQEDSAENKQILRRVCAVYHATCTSAYTCFQVDTFEDFVDAYLTWGENIQNNYCMIDSPFEP
ncbi:hypothetical protein [Chryseobacterium sp.]|uniref:hypothetical protein n=1 Tax=Chryseobacterium sp. TaxID=1871047 RepID=UPI002FC7E529